MILIAAALLAPQGLVVKNGMVYDGTGRPGIKADIRIVGDTIEAVGRNVAQPGDETIDAGGLAVAPGFIDAHSHADGGIFENRDAETQIRQGITTAVVGEDGGSSYPLKSWFAKLKATPPSINFASFVGHGTVRSKVMGDADRKSTDQERGIMAALVEDEMKEGALGLSSGLEYQPGRYADTSEVVALAKAARKHGGIYISHLRNEDNTAMQAIDELIQIAKEAKIPAQINHIKLGSARVWGHAGNVLRKMADARKKGFDITADIYPYLYWQSTIRVLIPTEDFSDRKLWERGLADVGGPGNVRLTTYSPEEAWEGKTLAEISTMTGKDAITLAQEIIDRTHGSGSGSESVVVTAMSDKDVKAFMKSPLVMFCSDGGLKGSHPRGAGSFPRILGHYSRELGVMPLAEAIHKMTGLTAKRFGFRDRGILAKGKKADLVIFDPTKVRDTATVADPQAKPEGIPTVIVNGKAVLRDGNVTGEHPGVGIRRR